MFIIQHEQILLLTVQMIIQYSTLNHIKHNPGYQVRPSLLIKAFSPPLIFIFFLVVFRISELTNTLGIPSALWDFRFLFSNMSTTTRWQQMLTHNKLDLTYVTPACSNTLGMRFLTRCELLLGHFIPLMHKIPFFRHIPENTKQHKRASTSYLNTGKQTKLRH